MDCSPPGSSVHGILKARILEWVAMPSSRGSCQPRDGTGVSCIGSQILYHWATSEAQKSSLIKGRSDPGHSAVQLHTFSRCHRHDRQYSTKTWSDCSGYHSYARYAIQSLFHLTFFSLHSKLPLNRVTSISSTFMCFSPFLRALPPPYHCVNFDAQHAVSVSLESVFLLHALYCSYCASNSVNNRPNSIIQRYVKSQSFIFGRPSAGKK